MILLLLLAPGIFWKILFRLKNTNGLLCCDLSVNVEYKVTAAAAAKSLQSCPTLCSPIDSSPPDSPVPAFSRQEHWSGLPFPSPMRESEVAQWYLTLSDPMDCSLPGSSIHGIFQARVQEWSAIAFSDIKLTLCFF